MTLSINEPQIVSLHTFFYYLIIISKSILPLFEIVISALLVSLLYVTVGVL